MKLLANELTNANHIFPLGLRTLGVGVGGGIELRDLPLKRYNYVHLFTLPITTSLSILEYFITSSIHPCFIIPLFSILRYLFILFQFNYSIFFNTLLYNSIAYISIERKVCDPRRSSQRVVSRVREHRYQTSTERTRMCVGR